MRGEKVRKMGEKEQSDKRKGEGKKEYLSRIRPFPPFELVTILNESWIFMQTNWPIRLRTYKVGRVRLDEVQLLAKPNLQSTETKVKYELNDLSARAQLVFKPSIWYDQHTT